MSRSSSILVLGNEDPGKCHLYLPGIINSDSLGTCRRKRTRGEEQVKRETRSFLERGFILFSLWEGAMISTFLSLSTPLAPTPSCIVFPSDGRHLAHQVGYSQGLTMFFLGCGPYLLQVLPSTGPEFYPLDPSLDRLGPIHMKADGQGLPGPPGMNDCRVQAGRCRTMLDQSAQEKSQGMREGHTFTPGQGVVPVPVGAMLTCEDRVAHQLISWKALKGHRLSDIVASSPHNAIGKGLWVWALLKFIGWKRSGEEAT